MVELAKTELESNRPVFPNPLHEPMIWRWFKETLREAYEDDAKITEAMTNTKSDGTPPPVPPVIGV